MNQISRSEYHHTYYLKNKARLSVYNKKWRETHPEYCKAKREAFRQEHPNYRREHRLSDAEYSRKYKATHREKRREQELKGSLAWNHRNPEKVRARNTAADIPMEKFCELCPKDDSRIDGLERHHPDYEYPTLFVTVCRDCHLYAEEKREVVVNSGEFF